MKNVSTHSRLKAAGVVSDLAKKVKNVSTHSRLKAAGIEVKRAEQKKKVSTHSRLKAAGRCKAGRHQVHLRFNTQPPEGGWAKHAYL